MSKPIGNPVDQTARTDEGRAARREPAVDAAAVDAAAVDAAAVDAAAVAGAASETNPSSNGSAAAEGRDAAGRFAAGNKGGPGNPFAREVARIRKRIQAKLSDGEIDAICDALLARAHAGDVAAAKLLFSYGAGKPAASVDPDQLDVQEWNHWKSTAKMMYDLPEMIKSMMPEILLEMVRTVRPVASAELSKQMGQAFMNPESVLPPVPELVMARSDKPLKRGGKSAAGETTVGDRAAGAAADPRGSEHPASGRESRRRAWGLNQPRFGGQPPIPNGNRGGKQSPKKAKPPSATEDNGGAPAHGSGRPSSNGILPG